MKKSLKKISNIVFLVLFISLIAVLIGEKNIFNNKNLTKSELVEKLRQVKDGSKLSFSLGEKSYFFEIVNSSTSRILGLSGRDEIGSDGLLFVFNKKDFHSIWMKEMKFNIDLIWIVDGEVVDITYGLQAPLNYEALETLPTYSPSVPIDILIEVNEGFVEEKNINIGDRLVCNETIYEAIY